MPPAKSIVVIDDDEELVAFMVDILQKAGYGAACAFNGAEGLSVVKGVKPDLVLVDLSMPVMHGFQVIQEIRADPELKGVRVVAISGKSYPTDLRAAKEQGVDHYMVKPFTRPQLLDALERFLAEPTP